MERNISVDVTFFKRHSDCCKGHIPRGKPEEYLISDKRRPKLIQLTPAFVFREQRAKHLRLCGNLVPAAALFNRKTNYCLNLVFFRIRLSDRGRTDLRQHILHGLSM